MNVRKCPGDTAIGVGRFISVGNRQQEIPVRRGRECRGDRAGAVGYTGD